MSKKHFYEAPESELLLVKFEGNFLTSPGDDIYTQGGGGSYNPDKIIDNGGY